MQEKMEKNGWSWSRGEWACSGLRPSGGYEVDVSAGGKQTPLDLSSAQLNLFNSPTGSAGNLD